MSTSKPQSGAVIRAARQYRELGVGELADRAQISRRTLTKIETRNSSMTLKTLQAIADVLGFPAGSLIEGCGLPDAVLARLITEPAA